MILSRFTVALLAGLVVLGLAAASGASVLVNDQSDTHVQRELLRDRREVEQRLRIETRQRLDAIAPFAANADVRRALRRASGRRAGASVPDALTDNLEVTLRQLNGQLGEAQGQLVLAVDKHGYVVAHVGPGRIPRGGGLGAFPLVSRVLSGYQRDDVWLYGGSIYRMVGRPVIDRSEYVGALLHGMELDEGLARRLSDGLDGATVTFFRGTEIVAGYRTGGAPDVNEAASELERVLSGERIHEGHAVGPELLGEDARAVYSLIRGSASDAQVGYAISRERPRVASGLGMITSVPAAGWASAPYLILIPFALLLFGLAMLFMWLERDRPLAKLRAEAVEVAGGKRGRLDLAQYGGSYRSIAMAMNGALDRATGQSAGEAPAAADLDQLLGPAPSDGPGSFFSFASEPAGAASSAPPATAPSSGSSAAAAPASAPPSSAPPASAAAPPAPSAAPPPAPASARPGPPPPPPPTPKAAPPSPKAAADAEPGDGHPYRDLQDEGSQSGSIPAPPRAGGQLKRTLVGVPPAGEGDEEDSETMVARVPKELIARTAGANGEDPDEDAHHREVFQKFVEMKKECGESTQSLTFEKFAVTLRKNRDKIIAQHGARRVRFSVYKKEGKAKLKATPLRD